MKTKIITGSVVVVLIIITLIVYNSGAEKEEVQIEVRTERGIFNVLVTTTGELQAENSEKIMGPPGLRKVRVYNVKITDMIPEGTIVKEGDYVATLDRTEVETRLKDIEADLQKSESQYTATKLDTTLELRNARDELVNLMYNMEEMKIVMEQSKFEPPATIRQANINYEKAKRAYEQALENYNLKEKQAEAKMVETSTDVAEDKRHRDEILDVLDEFIIKAPKGGMVIYQKEWNGSKRKVGSQISAWDPVVATLPDLSTMISKTYVNEIDISKLDKGMNVVIGVDAFPDKKYNGIITEIANIGEQLPNSDAKVFEVLIRVSDSDSILKPAMTTSNSIKVATYENVLHIPLEAVQNNDSLTFVFKKTGFTIMKQIIVPGVSNENRVIVKEGLRDNDIVLLSVPENPDDYDYEGLDLVPSGKREAPLTDTSVTMIQEEQTGDSAVLQEKSKDDFTSGHKKRKSGSGEASPPGNRTGSPDRMFARKNK
ncbi:MAG: HlyD family efflux transporter periplasmic adaptor subunit [Bacteroidetes bacterium]|nr:HlyD family efflux transporter periplasmic adaptor subunit [Bacteroidota bacterium]